MKLPLFVLPAVLFFGFTSCSMPEEGGGTTSWQVDYSLPLTKITLPIRDAFDRLLKDSTLNITDPNEESFSVGDTFQLNYLSNDTNFYNFKLLNQKSLNQSLDVSSLKLANMPLIEKILKIPDSLSLDDLIDSEHTLKLVDTLISTEFRHILFDSLPDSASVTVNNSDLITSCSNVLLTLKSRTGIFFDIEIEKTLQPGESHTLKVPVKDLMLNDTMELILDAKIDDEVLPNIKELLSVSIGINDLNILDAFIKDDFLDYRFEYSADLPLPTDSFVLNYADVGKLEIPVEIFNPYPLDIELETSLPSVLDRAYARSNQIKSWEHIPETIEPKHLKGSLEMKISENENRLIIGVEDARVLTQWDKKAQRCTVPVHISGRVKSTGKFVSLNRLDEVKISTENGGISFLEMCGYYNRDAFFKGTKTSFRMPFQGTNSVMEKFRDKIKLIDNELVIDIDFLMRDHSTISAMNYWCIMEMYCGEDIRVDTLSWSMEDIRDKNMTSYRFDFNRVINSFPDSIKYTIDYEFPRNAEILFSDSLLKNDKDSSLISIPVNFNLALATSFAWDISDTIFLELGTTLLPLRFEDRWYEPMSDKSLKLEFDMFNETSFAGSMYCLAVPSSQRELIAHMTIEDMRDQFAHGGFDRDVIPLFGDKGVSLPRRGNSVINTITIPNDHLQDILYSDTLVVKQWMMILPTSDALLDTDFLSLAASLTLSGVQSTDMFNK